jgi:hypothetical protein
MIAAYGDAAGRHATAVYLRYLAAFTVVFFVGAWPVLRPGCRRATR